MSQAIIVLSACTDPAPWLRRRICRLVLAFVLTVATGLTGASNAEAQPEGKLATLNFNPSGWDDWDGQHWEERSDRLVSDLVRHNLVPDIIALQQVDGWLFVPPVRSCGRGFGKGAGDYDQVDLLLRKLKDSTGVTYRIAYLTGKVSSFPVEQTLPVPQCQHYTGQALLYNPARLVNLTGATPVSATRSHDDVSQPLDGMPHLRRSLPVCNRGTSLMSIAQLIDGPSQNDKCGTTPSGPAWVVMRDQGHIAGSFVRLAFVGEPSSAVDVFNVNPTAGQEADDVAATRRLLAAVPAPQDTGMNRFYPPLMIGDLNGTSVDAISSDFHPILQGVDEQSGIGQQDPFPSLNIALVDQQLVLPDLAPGVVCPGPKETALSDHCALFVSFKRETANQPLKGVGILGPLSTVERKPYHLTTSVTGGGSSPLTYRWEPTGQVTPFIDPTAGDAGSVQVWQVTVSDGRTSVSASRGVQAARDNSACHAACEQELQACQAPDPTGPTAPHSPIGKPGVCNNIYAKCMAKCGP